MRAGSSLSAPAQLPAGPRLESIDLVRGIIIVLMALDHSRDFLSNVTFYPLDLDKTNVPLFITRWITHFCAPAFCLLAGTGAFLAALRGKSRRKLSWFLFSRGLWILFLEITWVRCLGWQFDFDYHFIGLSVLWSLGWGMITLAGLIWLPLWAIALLSIGVIAGHNAFDSVKPEKFGPFAWLWILLHTPGGEFTIADTVRISVGYVLVPWIAVMWLGYALGVLWRLPVELRPRRLVGLGAAMTLLFVALRLINAYGDPTPWFQQKDFLFTIFSFVHSQKYPPSLLFLLMTLGPTLILLGVLERPTPTLLRPFLIFGRVPLFFYLLHLPIFHGLSVLLGHAGLGEPSGKFPLPIVYLAWAGVVAALYPLCRWFAELKRRRPGGWLSYL